MAFVTRSAEELDGIDIHIGVILQNVAKKGSHFIVVPKVEYLAIR